MFPSAAATLTYRPAPSPLFVICHVLLKAEFRKLKPIKLGDSDKVSIGEFVLAIGIPWSDTDAKIVDVEIGTREMQVGEVG